MSLCLKGTKFNLFFKHLQETELKISEFYKKTKKVDMNSISKFAPKIIEGTKKLKDWVESN